MSQTATCLVRGSINIDEVFQVKNIVQAGQTISSTGFCRQAGGKGANQAVSVAQAGGSVKLIGAIGTDGIWLKKFLKDRAVDVDGITIVKEATGRAIIQVDNANENCILLHAGANYTDAEMPKASDMLKGCTHLLVQNEIPLKTTLEYLATASSSSPRITSIWNPSPIPESTDEIVWEHIDWLIVNQSEMDGLFRQSHSINQAEVPAHIPQQAESAFQSMGEFSRRQSPSLNIICTLGVHGALAMLHSSVTQDPIFVYQPAVSVENVVDTTGAGDCFTGYFVAALMRNSGESRACSQARLEEALRVAAHAAALSIQREGAMSIPTECEVEVSLHVYGSQQV